MPTLETQLTPTTDAIIAYLTRCQDFTAGQYYGAFWSEKAYHGPLLDWHAGGSHHPRGAGSGALGLWLAGKQRGDEQLLRRAEAAFDWVVTRQHKSGGYFEIQNNEKPSDWERTGLEECSTIEVSFVIHGLANALLAGLPPKACYMECLQRAGHWYLSIEWPASSGIFPHHERSPYDTLNANLHAGESLAAIFTALKEIYDRPINIFYQGARRTIRHTLGEQWPSGCFPYRADNGITINYTSLVVWCLLNALDTLPQVHYRDDVAPAADVRRSLDMAGAFLRGCIADDGSLLWEENETSTSKYNMWTYALTFNVLRRIGGEENRAAAERLLGYMMALRTPSGLLPMRDRGEVITECAYHQADMLLFLSQV